MGWLGGVAAKIDPEYMLAWAWRDFHEDSLGSVYVCERPAARVEARPADWVLSLTLLMVLVMMRMER